MDGSRHFTLLVIICTASSSSWLLSEATGTDSIRFANYYSDDMVLQRAPASAVVWGYAEGCDSIVSVDLDGKKVPTTQNPAGSAGCLWKASLPATPAGGPHKITASSDYGSVTLSNVLFGDVWICSGQSNMQFTVPQAYNASEEIQKAANYPNIRVFTAQLVSSDTPTDELLGIMQQWAIASPASINGSAWGYFSATCWFFGKNLFDNLGGVPIGLLATSWGGTRVEAWSSPDALAKCNSREDHHKLKRFIGPNPNNPSVLWNSMIHPLLQMPIYGVVWYQGESNAGNAAKYTCSFPAMISDWRMKWHEATSGQTSVLFPFGFVQLAPTGNNNQTSNGFPELRWAQTAGQGWVPNSHMEQVFMAVASDLGDPSSPFGSIHPRDKQDVGWRLALGALAIAYGNKTADTIYFSVPLPAKAMLSNVGKANMVISAEISYQMTTEALAMRSPYGFELGCSSNQSSTDKKWVEGTLKRTDGTFQAFVEFPQCPSGDYHPFAVRYCWRDDPCSFMQCPLYGGPAMLPSPPYMIDVLIK